MRLEHRRTAGVSVMTTLTILIGLNVAPSSAGNASARCQTANLSLGFVDRISPKTGEHGVRYMLTNRGHTVCQLRGYPGVSLYDNKGRVLPFRYVRGGKTAYYVTQAAPKAVVLKAGSHAYFLVAKYRCDIGVAMIATTVHIYPPDSTSRLKGPASPDAGVSALTYCTGGTKDPGQRVEISPVEATELATITTIAK
jgi:hypothetical protein